ncbi:hypothetical protein AA313_de0200190 [Arthrobotrys entomopaga]|nr:hypothetical protein AA313_de0200190 [Arthrobotrys entomopaga]
MSAPTCEIQVTVHPKWVATFKENGIKFCTSFAVASTFSTHQYNVIATAQEVKESQTILWGTEENYSIAWTMDAALPAGFNPTSTRIQPIKFGQSIRLDDNWVASLPANDHDVPADAFCSVNDTDHSAGVIVYKDIDGNPTTPIHVTSIDSTMPPPGRNTFRPTRKILLFFHLQDQGTVFDQRSIPTLPREFNYTNVKKAVIHYEEKGSFVLNETVLHESPDLVEGPGEGKAPTSKL